MVCKARARTKERKPERIISYMPVVERCSIGELMACYGIDPSLKAGVEKSVCVIKVKRCAC